jgi:hypothetical protein
MKPHVFVAMPFGVKKDNQGNEIDFNPVGCTTNVGEISLTRQYSDLSGSQWSRNRV